MQYPLSGIEKSKIQISTEISPPKALSTKMTDVINNLSPEEYNLILVFLNTADESIANTPSFYKHLWGNETLTSKDDTYLSTNKSINENFNTPYVFHRDSIKKNLHTPGFLTPDNTAYTNRQI